jgi:hypothetical protein
MTQPPLSRAIRQLGAALFDEADALLKQIGRVTAAASLTVGTLAGPLPSDLVVAWPQAARSPLVRSFVQVAWAAYRD